MTLSHAGNEASARPFQRRASQSATPAWAGGPTARSLKTPFTHYQRRGSCFFYDDHMAGRWMPQIPMPAAFAILPPHPALLPIPCLIKPLVLNNGWCAGFKNVLQMLVDRRDLDREQLRQRLLGQPDGFVLFLMTRRAYCLLVSTTSCAKACKFLFTTKALRYKFHQLINHGLKE
jgi:hypothetical protein